MGKKPPAGIGDLVDIGDRRLSVRVRGSGSPTVVFESGAGSPHYVWRPVEKLLPADVTTVAYERAGLGWSDPPPEPWTGDHIAHDLSRLLDALNLAPPYLLVAHSAGALYARLFQAAHQNDVVGIVFVDAVDGDTYEQGRRELRPLERALASAHQRLIPPIMRLADRVGLVATLAGRGGPDASLADDPEVVEAHNALWTGRNVIAGGRPEGRALEETARTVARLGDLGPLPVSVVYAGERRGLFRRIEGSWTATQRRLASLSSRSELVAAEGAGHFVQLDRPDVVAAAIQRMIELAPNVELGDH